MSSLPRAAGTWMERDLPVLVAVVDALDGGGRLWVGDMSVPGLTIDDLQRSLRALEDGGFVKLDWRGPQIAAVTGITAESRRAAGAWPSEIDVTMLIERLEAAMPAQDPATRGRMEKLRAVLKEIGPKFAAELLAAVGTKLIGGV